MYHWVVAIDMVTDYCERPGPGHEVGSKFPTLWGLAALHDLRQPMSCEQDWRVPYLSWAFAADTVPSRRHFPSAKMTGDHLGVASP